MMTSYRLALLLLISLLLVTACTAAPTPTALPTPVAQVEPTSTQPAAPTATEPPTATATAITTPTKTSTATATATPTQTFTPTSTATPRNTATPRPTATQQSAAMPRDTATPQPTQVPATTAPAAVNVPPPESFEFTPGGFMKYLDYAHVKYQKLLQFVGGASKGDYVGSCTLFDQYRGELLGIVAFTNAPEPWKAMVDEYNSLRTQAIVVIDPITQICRGGGGTISAETDRQINSLLDHAQNRMYQMQQQAKTMQ